MLVVDDASLVLAMGVFVHDVFEDLDAAVLGAVVDEDVFDVVVRLGKKGASGGGDVFFSAVNWYTDAYLDFIVLHKENLSVIIR